MIYYNAGKYLLIGTNLNDILGKYQKIMNGDIKGFYKINNLPEKIIIKLKEQEEIREISGENLLIDNEINKITYRFLRTQKYYKD